MINLLKKRVLSFFIFLFSLSIIIANCTEDSLLNIVNDGNLLNQKPAEIITKNTNDLVLVSKEEKAFENGIAMLDLQLNSYHDSKKSELEKQEIELAILKIRSALKKVAKNLYSKSEVVLETSLGEREVLQGEEVISSLNYNKIKYTLVNYHFDNVNKEVIYDEEWKYVAKSDNAREFQSIDSYSVSDVTFEKGTASAIHSSSLSAVSGSYTTIQETLSLGISGTIKLGNAGICFFLGWCCKWKNSTD